MLRHCYIIRTKKYEYFGILIFFTNLINEGAKHFGLNSQELPLSKSSILSTLKEGYPIIATVGPGTFIHFHRSHIPTFYPIVKVEVFYQVYNSPLLKFY